MVGIFTPKKLSGATDQGFSPRAGCRVSQHDRDAPHQARGQHTWGLSGICSPHNFMHRWRDGKMGGWMEGGPEGGMEGEADGQVRGKKSVQRCSSTQGRAL